MADPREPKRLRLSTRDPNVWEFLSPWFEQLKVRLLVVHDGYLQVLHPEARRWGCGQNIEQDQDDKEQPKRYDTSNWRTREALELLVYAVNNRAWTQILIEKCALRFAEEEDLFDANNYYYYDDDDNDEAPRIKSQMFTFECERAREVPLSPRFYFSIVVGCQNDGELSSVAKWKDFFLSHTASYKPCPDFLEGKRRILMKEGNKVD